MEKRPNWFLLAVAAWLLLLLGIFLVSPGGAQTFWHRITRHGKVSRVCVLSVSTPGVEMGCLTPENKIYLHPSVKTVCNPARFRRNMRAAVKGSSKAHRYLEVCAAKLSK
jgi:hypothetical protein